MLFNIHTLEWDAEILRLLDIPEQMLPEVRNSAEIYGETDSALFGSAIPISGAIGDQQASLFGQTCFEAGDVKNTYGTGCFMLMNTGAEPVRSEHGLLTTIAWGLGGEVSYALEGSVFVGGAVVQWLRDELGIIRLASDTEAMAFSVESNGGLYLVPAFVGMGAPYWDSYARGIMVGITRGTNRNHIARAALESIAFETYDLAVAMRADASTAIATLGVDGGASENNFLMQFQADMLNTPVVRPLCTETTALGAAYMAGIGVGFWTNLQEIKSNRAEDKTFNPSISDAERIRLLTNWKRAVERSKNWIETV
jgi:glycerol kinase